MRQSRVEQIELDINVHGRFALDLPRGSRILSFGLLASPVGPLPRVAVWVLVYDGEAASETVPLVMARGATLLPNLLGEHVGTVVLYEGDLVLHLFMGR